VLPSCESREVRTDGGTGRSIQTPFPRRESHNSELLRLAFDKGYYVDDAGVLWSYTGNAMHPGPGGTGYPRFTPLVAVAAAAPPLAAVAARAALFFPDRLRPVHSVAPRVTTAGRGRSLFCEDPCPL